MASPARLLQQQQQEEPGPASDIWSSAARLPPSWPFLRQWELCHWLESLVARQREQSCKSGQFSDTNARLFATKSDARLLCPVDCACSNLDSCRLRGEYQQPAFVVCPQETTFPTGAVQEAELVRECLYALQGLRSAVLQLERLSKEYGSQAADRSSHRLPTLWQRSVSTSALAKLLSAIARSGQIRCQLEEFVNFFLYPGHREDALFSSSENLNADETNEGRNPRRKSRKKTKDRSYSPKSEELERVENAGVGNRAPPFSLVNQAFAAAVKSVLQGHLAALNTLAASVSYRRLNFDQGSEQNSLPDEHDEGLVIGLGCEEITLLELYLHSSELRLQLQVLGAICLLRGKPREDEIEKVLVNGKETAHGGMKHADGHDDVCSSIIENFPKGADLLTYLYKRLKDADPLHVGLLRFLFSHAYQPYSVFIRSWIYCATVRDPYREFILDQVHDLPSIYALKESSNDFTLMQLKVREGSSIPCFLKNTCTALVRAGQQLQVLLKLTETSRFLDQVPNFLIDSDFSQLQVGMVVVGDILSCWTDFSSENCSAVPTLVFTKEKLKQSIKHRERETQSLLERFDKLFDRPNMQFQEEGALASKKKNIRGYKHLPEFKSNFDAAIDEIHDIYSRERIKTMKLKKEVPNSVGGEAVYQKPISGSHTTGFYCEVGLQSMNQGQEQNEPALILGQLDSDSKLQIGKDCTGQEKNCKRISNQFKTIEYSRRMVNPPETGLDFSVGNRRWLKEPCEVAIVNNRHEEEDTDSSLAACGNDNQHQAAEHFSIISDYQSEPVCPQLGIFVNPFLETMTLKENGSHEYALPMFRDIDHLQEINSNITGDEVCMPWHLGTCQMAINNCPEVDNIFTKVCLEKVGPEKFFGIANIHEMCRRYGYRESRSVEINEFDRMFSDFDLVFGEIWNCGGPMIDKSLSLKLSQMSISAGHHLKWGSGNLGSLDGNRFFSEYFNCSQASQSLQYKIAEQPNDLPGHNSFAADELGNGLSQDAGSDITVFSNAHDTDIPSQLDDCKAAYGVPSILDSNIEMRQKMICGGASWETSLKFIEDHGKAGSDKPEADYIDKEEVPLEVVVDNCIVKEILFQYHCISHITVRLLQKVFGLQQHLAALRRYFLMESGDWADEFAAALCQHVWCPIGTQQRQLEVQGMLEMALQRSSCEGDVYSERLNVQIMGCSRTTAAVIEEASGPSTDVFGSTYVNSNCICAFDFIMLGYRVDWPLTLILTLDSFKLYNEIFSTLLRIKLCVYALGDIWRCLKGLEKLLIKLAKSENGKQWEERFRVLMSFRQQIGHFITSLQHYIQSQVLHVMWSRFLCAIRDEVKDMQDLEAVHMAYLNDALNQCFLSDEMKGVKMCIDEVMQCLLDFRACLCYSQEGGRNSESDLDSDSLYFGVLEVQDRYKKSLQQIYYYYLNSEGQHQLSLSYFWMCLDFNGYFCRFILNHCLANL